jgi:hypothetical protein
VSKQLEKHAGKLTSLPSTITRTADTTDLRGAKASVDAWIALRVTFVTSKASDVILVERVRRIPLNMSNGNRASNKGEATGRRRRKERGVLWYPTRHDASTLPHHITSGKAVGKLLKLRPRVGKEGKI